MSFKIDWASHIVGSKFTVFALFYFVFEGNFPSTIPRGVYIWRGDLTEGFLRYRFRGLIFGILRVSYADVTRAKRDQTENREWRLGQQSTQHNNKAQGF